MKEILVQTEKRDAEGFQQMQIRGESIAIHWSIRGDTIEIMLLSTSEKIQHRGDMMHFVATGSIVELRR